jgi:hypothetical protein
MKLFRTGIANHVWTPGEIGGLIQAWVIGEKREAAHRIKDKSVFLSDYLLC